jgi:RNA polymerase sigma factor (sigma-70 family)
MSENQIVILDEEYEENFNRHFLPYARAHMRSWVIPGCDADGMCAESYDRIRTQIDDGKVRLVRKDECRWQFKDSERYPLTGYIKIVIGQTIWNHHKAENCRHRVRNASGDIEYETMSTQEFPVGLRIEQREEFEKYWKDMHDSLSDRNKDIVRRKVIEGESSQEIADSYDLSATRINQIYAAARKKILGE